MKCHEFQAKAIFRREGISLPMAFLSSNPEQAKQAATEIGYPVIGDEVYSNGKNQWNIKGQCLHAKSLKFKHPVTKKEMFIEAELPKYFKDIIEQMRQRGTGL